MLRKTLTVVAIAASLVACGQQKPAASASALADASKTDKKDNKPAKLIVAQEDLTTVQNSALASGPVITGSVQPERRADLRAEVSSVVLQVLKENGDAVKKGDVLVKLDETAIRDNVNSADDAVRNATQAFEQAERTVQRQKTLRASGMTSLQALDDAEVRRNAAQAEVSAAKARAVQARQQLQRTVVRAPFDGVVSDRKVSAGDTAAAGKELLKVIDPTSMRFAGRVTTDKIGMVKLGQTVSFRINGYGTQDFRGKVTRIDPAANDVTRQVEVYVAFAENNQPRVSGLYAEGSIEASTVSALTVPENALVKNGDKSYAWKIADKKLQKVDVQLGKRDQRTGNYEVKLGLNAGDTLMRNPGSNLKDGQIIEMAASKPAVAQSASIAEGN